VFVRGDGDIAIQLVHLRFIRPAPDAHRIQAGVAHRQGQIALRRHTPVGPAAEAVEAVAQRAERLRDVPVLGERERTPERIVRREQEDAALDGVGDDGVDEVRDGELPVPPRIRVMAGHRHDRLGHGGPFAAEDPDDPWLAVQREHTGRGSRAHEGVVPAGQWRRQVHLGAEA
jgi:hypothetical protein